jgi:hypothetical protein
VVTPSLTRTVEGNYDLTLAAIKSRLLHRMSGERKMMSLPKIADIAITDTRRRPGFGGRCPWS